MKGVCIMIYSFKYKNTFQILQDMQMEQTSMAQAFNGLKAQILGSNDDKNIQSLFDFISTRMMYINDGIKYVDNYYKERYFKNNEQYKSSKRVIG